MLQIIDKVPSLLNCEIGLLIGYKCPRALAPRQTILGKGNEPYAGQTDLRQSTVVSSHLETDRSSLCHHLTVKEIPPNFHECNMCTRWWLQRSQ